MSEGQSTETHCLIRSDVAAWFLRKSTIYTQKAMCPAVSTEMSTVVSLRWWYLGDSCCASFKFPMLSKYRDQTKNTSRFCICRKFGVFLKKEAYSFDPVAPVLFSPVRGAHLMEDPVIQMISQKHKKSAAQVGWGRCVLAPMSPCLGIGHVSS